MKNRFIEEGGDDYNFRSGSIIYNLQGVEFMSEYVNSRRTNLYLNYDEEEKERQVREIKADFDDVTGALKDMVENRELESAAGGGLIEKIYNCLDGKYEKLEEIKLLKHERFDERPDGAKLDFLRQLVKNLGSEEILYKEIKKDGLFVVEKRTGEKKWERFYFEKDFNIKSYELFEKQWKEKQNKEKKKEAKLGLKR